MEEEERNEKGPGSCGTTSRIRWDNLQSSSRSFRKLRSVPTGERDFINLVGITNFFFLFVFLLVTSEMSSGDSDSDGSKRVSDSDEAANDAGSEAEEDSDDREEDSDEDSDVLEEDSDDFEVTESDPLEI